MKKSITKWMSAMCMLLTVTMVLPSCGTKSNSDKESTGESTAVAKENKIHKLRLMGTSVDKNYFKWDQRKEFPSWKKFEEDMKARNIELTFEHIIPEQYSIVLQTKFAAGSDLPDMVYLKDYDDTAALALAKNKLIIDVNEAIKKYSDGSIKKLVDKSLQFDGKNSTAPDGKRYWFTNLNSLKYEKPDGSTVPCPYVISNAIRKDWLDKFNLKMPTTLNEYITALRTFREKDANGNGQKDEILMFDTWSYNFMTGIAQWFGLGSNLIAVDVNKGEVVTPWYQPGVKEYFKTMRMLAEEGIFDVSMANATDEQCNRKIAENKVSALRSYSTGLVWEELINKDPNGKELYLILPPLQSVQGITPYSLYEPADTAWQKFAITKDCKDVEGAINLMDYFYTEDARILFFNGVKDVDFKDMADTKDTDTIYNISKNGEFHMGKEKDQYPPATDEEKYNMRKGIPLTRFLGNSTIPRVSAGNNTFTSKDPRNSIKQALQVQLMQNKNAFYNNNNNFYAIATEDEINTTNKYYTSLEAASKELSIKLILGQKSLDDWDKHIAELKKNGLEEVLTVFKARHERYKKGGTN